MEENELNELILKLKTLLEDKHSDKFFKFYLCKMPDGRWESLVSTKLSDGTRGGSYYRIVDGKIEEEILD